MLSGVKTGGSGRGRHPVQRHQEWKNHEAVVGPLPGGLLEPSEQFKKIMQKPKPPESLGVAFKKSLGWFYWAGRRRSGNEREGQEGRLEMAETSPWGLTAWAWAGLPPA